MPHFTKDNARQYAARAHEAQRERIALAMAAAHAQPHNDNAAQERLSRLWASLEKIDGRIARELARDRPNVALVKELNVIARGMNAQALELTPASNGRSKPGPDPVAVLPDPLP